jgi:hypothetical protein
MPPAKDGRIRVGRPIEFWPDTGPPLFGFVTATMHQHGKDWYFLVLADGNGTCEKSTLISDERFEELKQRLKEKEPT